MPSYVVVGASRGLGYEWLRQLSSSPENTVIGLARAPTTVEAKLAADEISNVKILAADLSDHRSLTTAATDVAALTGGSLDYLIVNGVHQNPAADFLTPTEFSGREDLLHDYMVKALEINVIGAMYAINAFLPLVRKSSIKKIVVITTGLADLDSQRQGTIGFFVTYSALKAALNMVVVRYSIELKSEGVTLLALSPGLVNTQEAPPPPEVMPRIANLMQDVVTANPEFKGPSTPAESVRQQRKVIEDITHENSGAFLSHFGNREWI